MLAKLLRGGRGGAVRLKLYLCITLIAASTPYDMKRPVPNETCPIFFGDTRQAAFKALGLT